LNIEQGIQTESSLVDVSTQTNDPILFYLNDSYNSTGESGISTYNLVDLQAPMDCYIENGGSRSDIQGYIQYLENLNINDRSDIDTYINYLHYVDGWREDVDSAILNVSQNSFESIVAVNEAMDLNFINYVDPLFINEIIAEAFTLMI